MGAKYSHGVWEQFADQASTILGDQIFRFSLENTPLCIKQGRGQGAAVIFAGAWRWCRPLPKPFLAG